MKLEDLLNEQSSKPVTRSDRPIVAHTPKTPSRKDRPAPVRKPITSRAELLEAVQMLGGNVRISSINGGKNKRKKEQN